MPGYKQRPMLPGPIGSTVIACICILVDLESFLHSYFLVFTLLGYLPFRLSVSEIGYGALFFSKKTHSDKNREWKSSNCISPKGHFKNFSKTNFFHSTLLTVYHIHVRMLRPTHSVWYPMKCEYSQVASFQLHPVCLTVWSSICVWLKYHLIMPVVDRTDKSRLVQ